MTKFEPLYTPFVSQKQKDFKVHAKVRWAILDLHSLPPYYLISSLDKPLGQIAMYHTSTLIPVRDMELLPVLSQKRGRPPKRSARSWTNEELPCVSKVLLKQVPFLSHLKAKTATIGVAVSFISGFLPKRQLRQRGDCNSSFHISGNTNFLNSGQELSL
ncbi:hypothetical protein CEXT_282811 [Caerostris extrusa]|uniref:Uncharacterized protein n=1 Tax=Caerostris extrusa TaxID=172846 RepID=A0AAV4XJX5_CAEEX|nr:hypothetical protein CEXT_282811 [Caerostris extrusa]